MKNASSVKLENERLLSDVDNDSGFLSAGTVMCTMHVHECSG